MNGRAPVGADLPAPAVHGAVAAVLAVMPIDPDDGTTLVSWENDPTPLTDDSAEFVPIWSDPEPLAAKYAAAVLRHLAEVLRRADPMWGGSYDDDDLAALADEIDPPKETDR